MATKKPHPRLLQELNQIKTLLKDFNKVKKKCQDHANILGTELAILEKYKKLQRSTMIKIEVLDFAGLVNLKNQLVKIVTNLFDEERQMSYKRQREEVRAKERPKINRSFETKPQKIEENLRQVVSRAIENQDNNDLSFDFGPTPSQIRRQKNNIVEKIPVYKSKSENNENKLDRISKYIASLKKNIKTHVENAGSKWRTKEFLLDDSSFLKLKEQLQRFEMREEQLIFTIGKTVQKRVQQYFSNCQKVEEEQGFKVYRVPKSDLKIIEEQKKKNNSTQQISQKKPIKKEIEMEIENKAEKDFEEIKSQLNKENQSFVQIFSKINQAVEKGNEKLTEIREKRKKKFQQDDDIWSELE